MRIYVIGPVTGVEDDNRPAFEEARRELREELGCEVEIPHDAVSPDATWETAMRSSVKAMTACDAVAMLPGWMSSKGAGIEYNLARQIGMPIAQIETWVGK